jgi:hypothetical protein
VVDWPEATILPVIAYGGCYFLATDDPEQYVQHGASVTGAILNEERTLLILAYRGGDLEAYGRDGKRVWSRDRFAVDRIELKSCTDGIISAEIEYDYSGSWRSTRIRAADGSDVR